MHVCVRVVLVGINIMVSAGLNRPHRHPVTNTSVHQVSGPADLSQAIFKNVITYITLWAEELLGCMDMERDKHCRHLTYEIKSLFVLTSTKLTEVDVGSSFKDHAVPWRCSRQLADCWTEAYLTLMLVPATFCKSQPATVYLVLEPRITSQSTHDFFPSCPSLECLGPHSLH